MDDRKACVLIQGLPAGAFCGIDLLSFTSSPRFQGIKEIPKGWHFVFAGANSAISLRHGVWLKAQGPVGNAPEVLALRWHAENEQLDLERDDGNLLRLKANLGSMWKENLTPYRQAVPQESEDLDQEGGGSVEESNAWPQLTDCISTAVLDRILGEPGADSLWMITSASSAKEDEDVIPGLTTSEAQQETETELHFLHIDLKQTWRKGAIGRERTEAAQDRSWVLEEITKSFCDHPLDILGELQFCFLMVLTLNNNSCLEQWKRILGVLLTCKSAAVKQSALFVQFLATLKLQLEHCSDAEGGLIDLSEQGAALLKGLVKRFRQGLDQQPGTQAKIDVMDELDDLEDYLRAEHSWFANDVQLRHGTVQLEDGEEVDLDLGGFDEEDETGDYAPTIVDMTPELARQLGLDVATNGNIPADSREPRSAKDEHAQFHDEVDEEEEEDQDQDLEDMDARY